MRDCLTCAELHHCVFSCREKVSTIAWANASAYSSSTKWPPSKKRKSALGRACFKASVAAGVKKGSLRP